jgi:hypothetical protein
MKLNLGCGRTGKEYQDYVNLDRHKLSPGTLVHDLDKYPWPFRDDQFERITAHMILEHLNDKIAPLEEIWRISKSGAVISIKVPLFPSFYAMSDPTHKQFFTYYTFDYFTGEGQLNYYAKTRFKIIKRKIIFSWNPILNTLAIPMNIFPKIYTRYFSFILPSNELQIEITIIK